MEFISSGQLAGLIFFLVGMKVWIYCSAMERDEYLKKNNLERILIFKPDIEAMDANAKMIKRSFVLSLLGAALSITGVLLFLTNMS